MNLLSFFPRVLLAVLFIETGCGSIAMQPEVNVSIENKSARLLENVRAHFGEYECAWGLVAAGATKIYGHYQHPITRETELHWDEAGGHRVQKLELGKIYPPGKSGRLSFTIYEGHAEVEFREVSPVK
jgi:hypothetical protein